MNDEELRALLAAVREECDWRRTLYIFGLDDGARGGDALENAHLLDNLAALIRVLEERLAASE